MKSKLLFLALTLFTISSLNAQNWWKNSVKGEGPIVKKTINLDNFTGFSLSNSGNVYLRKGNTQSVEVETHQNLIDILNTEIKDNNWKIKFEKNVRNLKTFNVYITIPTLTKAYISGSGDIKSENKFSGLGELMVGISGSGDINLDIDAQKVFTKISGSGDIDLKGSAKDLEVKISGSGDIKAYNLNAENCKVSISGSGNVGVNASEELYVRTSGSGDVYYTGRPRVNSKTSGSGDVRYKEGSRK